MATASCPAKLAKAGGRLPGNTSIRPTCPIGAVLLKLSGSMTSSQRSFLDQNPHANPWIAPSTKPATVNSANPVRNPTGLPEIGYGLAGAKAASIPKGGNRGAVVNYFFSFADSFEASLDP